MHFCIACHICTWHSSMHFCIACRSFCMEAGFNSSSPKHGRKRKLLIDGFVASPPEPLRVSEIQAPYRTRLIEARAVRCLDLANEARAVKCLDLANSSPSRSSSCKVSLIVLRAKSSIERGVNATDHRCEWRLTMAMWGRMLLPPIHICPQEPWEAQEYRMLTGTGVGSIFFFLIL